MDMQKTHWGLASTYKREIMGVATLLVFLTHNFISWPSGNLIYIVRRLFDYGNVGVELFLLLSGIGLYYSYSKKTSIASFYIKRLTRLLIPYVIICVPYLVWRDLYLGLGDFFTEVTQLAFPLKGFITYWYIPASLVFYLMSPLIFWYLERFDVKGGRLTREMKLTLLCLVQFAVCFAIFRKMPTFFSHCELALTRIIIFTIGCYLGRLAQGKKAISGHWVVISFAYCAMFLLFREMISVKGFWYRMLYVPFGIAVLILLMWLLNLRIFSPLRPFFAFFGDRSIEMYLVHVSLINVYKYYFAGMLKGHQQTIAYVCVLGVSVAVSFVLHFVILKLSNLFTSGITKKSSTHMQ